LPTGTDRREEDVSVLKEWVVPQVRAQVGVQYSRFSENWQPKKITMNGYESDRAYPSLSILGQGSMSTSEALIALRDTRVLTCMYGSMRMPAPWQIRVTPQLPSLIQSPNHREPQVR